LSAGHIHFRNGFTIQRARLGVFNYPDNRRPIFFPRILVIQRHALANGVFAGEVAPRERLVDDDHVLRLFNIFLIKWTALQRGPEIFGVRKAYDYVAGRTARFQTLITAVVSNRELIDGLEIIAQDPKDLKAEAAYLKATAKENYESMAEVEQRFLELLHYRKHELEYRKRTEIALEIVRQIEGEGQFPETDYAFDNGVLTLGLTQFIEGCGKHSRE
jgi:hypothetical protein